VISKRSALLRRGRVSASGVGAALLALAFGADSLGLGGPGFGSLQSLLAGFGVCALLLGVLPARWLLGYARLALALVAAYLCLVASEAALSLSLGTHRSATHSLRGIVQPSRWGGYELTPNWIGHYDDGRTRVEVRINAMGDRDDPPEAGAGAAPHLLLLGDSQTFGMGLAKADTIEGQLEALSAGTLLAYNLGVHGYGPEDSLEHFRERESLVATHTFFLLYGNDLRFDNCRKALHTAFEGYIVPRDRPDGRPYTPEELRRELDEAVRKEQRGWLSRLKTIAVLEDLRGRLDAQLDPERVLRAGPVDQFSTECALSAARHVDEIGALSRERGQTFAVVILPTVGEAALQRYAQPMQLAVDELRRRGVPMLEVRPLLTPADYLPRDEHLAPSGAAKVASAIDWSLR
jgi:hypothetical protein